MFLESAPNWIALISYGSTGSFERDRAIPLAPKSHHFRLGKFDRETALIRIEPIVTNRDEMYRADAKWHGQPPILEMNPLNLPNLLASARSTKIASTCPLS